MSTSVFHAGTDTEHKLNLRGGGRTWDGPQKHRIVFVGLSVPGYYSIPIRLLCLVCEQDDGVRSLYDSRYAEWDISDDLDEMAETITVGKPDIIAFSVNIWNCLYCIDLSHKIKRRLPECTILCGGQEVSGSVTDYLALVQSWDYLIDGEGPISIIQFLHAWKNGGIKRDDRGTVSGLLYRDEEGVTQRTGTAENVPLLDELPSPILEGCIPFAERDGLGVLLESVRGCPFRCSFCFEGSSHCRPRTASVERLRSEFVYAHERGATLFHVMDPIIANSRLDRTRELMTMFEDAWTPDRPFRVTLEGYAERLSPEGCRILGRPFVSVDIGMQSLNPETLAAIHRPFDQDRFLQGYRNLSETEASICVYLIIGLPYETVESALRGVRFVIDLKPDQLFFNELLLLNGTELRRDAEKWGYVFDEQAPYRVYASRWMTEPQMTFVQSACRHINTWYKLCSGALGGRGRGGRYPRQLHRVCPSPCERSDQCGFGTLREDTSLAGAVVDVVVCSEAEWEHIPALAGRLCLGGAYGVNLCTSTRLADSDSAPWALLHSVLTGVRLIDGGEDEDKTCTLIQDIKCRIRQGRKLDEGRPHIEWSCSRDRLAEIQDGPLCQPFGLFPVDSFLAVGTPREDGDVIRQLMRGGSWVRLSVDEQVRMLEKDGAEDEKWVRDSLFELGLSGSRDDIPLCMRSREYE